MNPPPLIEPSLIARAQPSPVGVRRRKGALVRVVAQMGTWLVPAKDAGAAHHHLALSAWLDSDIGGARLENGHHRPTGGAN